MKSLFAVMILMTLAVFMGCEQTETPPEQPSETETKTGEEAPGEEVNNEEETETEKEKAKPEEGEKKVQAESQESEETGEPEDEPSDEPANEDKQEETEETKSPEDIYKELKRDDEVGILDTNYGTMKIEFYPELAPETVARIKELINQGFYDALIFHRIAPGFCIQGGDPRGTGRGGSGQNLPPEFTEVPFIEGSLGMARSNEPDSGDCQFFITLDRAPHLDNKYTLFGRVIEGMDVAHKIEKVEVEGERPKKDVRIIRFSLREED